MNPHRLFRFRLLAVLVAVVVPLCMSSQPDEAYIQHSSGFFLAKDADGSRASIQSASSPNVQKLQFLPNGDGTLCIAYESGAETLFLALEGSWNAVFQPDSSTSRAHFTIEQSGSIAKFRCQYNGKYLGTDGSTDGRHAYADKSGDNVLHQWRLVQSTDEAFPVDTVSYMVNTAARLQRNEGWGVSLCWWANMCGKWDDAKIDEIIDWLVSPTGLNYNIFRYNIGGGDDPLNRNCTPHHMGSGKGLRAEMEGFKDSTLDVYHWERDAAQRKIMLKIREKRPDAIFEAFSNSAPYYMTYSGCVAGNASAGKDNLRPEYYEEFAHYLVDVCKHYRDEYGIVFKTLEPFNEPNTSYWGANGGQEGCHFDFSSQVAFLRVLAPILRESGLTTVISASDETSASTSVSGFKAYQDAGVMDLVGQWNTHTYSASVTNRSQVGTLARSEGKMVWQSETGSGGTGIAGNLSLMQRAVNDIRYILPDAWVDWQYVEESGDQWCTVRGNFSRQTYQRVRSYYVHQQLTRFIPQGWRYVSSLEPTSLAALSPQADTLVLVAINEQTQPVVHRAQVLFALPDVDAIRAWRTSESENLAPVSAGMGVQADETTFAFELPAQSITTLVVPLRDATAVSAELQAGQPYLVQPQYNVSLALTAQADGSVTIETVAPSQAQVWTLEERDGAYVLRNGDGMYINDGGSSYGIRATDQADDATVLTMVPLDPYFYRIMTDATHAFDLKNEAYTAGTVVGSYAYGSSVSAGHRNWRFTPLPKTDDQPDGIVELTQDRRGGAGSSQWVYDLSGRRVETTVSRSQLRKGIYISNGKKILGVK